MIFLGIETSCDETALALIETRQNNGIFECRVIASLIHSQAELHSPYGGVFPMLAKREHEKNLPIVLEKLLAESTKIQERGTDAEKPPIDAIAVTEGPGLEPALWTGIVFAEELSKKWNVPIIPVNHMEGHIVGSLLASDIADGKWQTLKTLPTPALALLISGGHTELVSIEKIGSYRIVGRTKDDAVGEAFDKVARLLGLPYPGGPRVSKLANEAREKNIVSSVKLPRPMIASKDLDFSFSGLKTAVLYAIREAEKTPYGKLNEDSIKGLCREFEDAVTETLITKLRTAIEETGSQSIIIGGGVAANITLRNQFETIASEYSIPLFMPSKHISGDNALMIALAGALNTSQPSRKLKAHGTKKLGVN